MGTMGLRGQRAVLLPLGFLSSAPGAFGAGLPVICALMCSGLILTLGFIHSFNRLSLNTFW